MKIALFGGTFDPIHNGHIALAEYFADRLELDKVYVVPANVAPQKQSARTCGRLRLEMCRMAVQGDGRFEVCDFELKREGLSYTFYTVEHLLELHPGARIYLIVGADRFLTLDRWHRFDELKQLVTFCAVPRGDISFEQLSVRALELEGMGCDTFVNSWEPVDISSTLIRSRAAEGLPLDGLVLPEVEDFIRRNGLYRKETTDMAGVNIDC